MNKIYNPIVWVNNSPPALNEDNLNAMSQGLSDLDDRVIELAGDIVLSVTECAEAAQAAQDAATTASNAATTATTKAGEASASATTASTKAGEASESATTASNKADAASASATTARNKALISEGFAVGEQDGTPVTSGSPYYQNNAEYYATEAGSSAQAAAASATEAESWSAHPPYIGSNGNWYVWDVTDAQYEDSGIDASITVSVGTTSTLPAGSSATVTNSGTSTDPVLNFGIPQGAAGTDGVSPEVTISSITGGHAVNITDEDHPSGQTFNVMDGDDGVSPAVTVSTITGGHAVTITDADHPSGQSFDVMDGTGAGDMLSSTYDPNSSVANAGGIAEYVRKTEGRYNVLNYGLKADAQYPEGTYTDNTQALTDLIALVPNGSVIFFPCGTYGFDGEITVNKDVTFLGENEEKQTAGTSPNRIHDPMSVLKYTGKHANYTMFKRSGYVDVNFVGLTFDGGNSYTVTRNSGSKSGNDRYEYLVGAVAVDEVEVEGVITQVERVNVNGVDMSVQAAGTVKNCQFWGFSGFGLRTTMHKYVEDCCFYMCKRGVVTTFTDSMLHGLWFCKCGTCIYMSDTSDHSPDTNTATVNVSDTWADQIINHFIESDDGNGYGINIGCVGVLTSNIWLDHIQMSAFYFPTAFLSGARISGTFGRVGMNYAGLEDADRTPEIAKESDFCWCGQYITESVFDLNIAVVEDKADKTKMCFSRLFTTRSDRLSNLNNKITCTKFPIAKLNDYTLPNKTNVSDFSRTSYFGSDGRIDRAGGLDYVNGLHFHNNDPNTSTWAPYVGALYYNYNKRILYKCTAINIVNNSYTFTWEEVHRGTQFETMPSPGLNLVGLIAQYTGTTTSAYTHGYFYECVNENNVRKWVQRDVQDTSNLLDKATYDPNDTVATAGGIPAYVAGQIPAATSVTVDKTGTASSSGTRYQRIGVDGVYTAIDGTKYMEIANTSSTTYTFNNSDITASSAIDVYTDTWGDNPSAVTSTTGSCTVTFAAAQTRTVRIYIK